MTNNNLIKEYKDKFNDATFCWNGDNKLGADFAKKKNKEMQKFISNLLTKKDQEHKAELEIVFNEVRNYLKGLDSVPWNEEVDRFIYSLSKISEPKPILDSHINKL